jgi:hypothetical protein
MVRADGHQNRGMYFPPFFCTNASSAKAPRRRILLAKNEIMAFSKIPGKRD